MTPRPQGSARATLERLLEESDVSTAIPARALLQHITILGKTGSGKSYAAKGVVEGLIDKGERVCIIDPTGGYWGLKSSATGKSGGFPVVVFGGTHADLPLGGAHGKAIAEVIATSSTPAVIDTSQMTVGERTRFFTDFATELLRKNATPLHLVIDEAHLFAPQSGAGGRGGGNVQANEMLHAANNLVSLGRSRGLRIILITQRPAKLHKDSLTQSETLVAMRLIAPQDRKAVEDWIKDNADEAKGKEIIRSLATLKTGQAWVWAPELDVLHRVTFPKIKTFDSSRAPTGSESGHGPVLAPIDRDAIAKLMEAVAADALANDPAKLKAEIANLRRQMQTAAVAAAKAGNVADPAAIEEAEKRGYEQGYLLGFKAGFKEGFGDGWLVVKNTAEMQLAKPALEVMPEAGPNWPPKMPAVKSSVARPKSSIAPKPLAQIKPFAAKAPEGGLTRPQQRVLNSLTFWKSIDHDAPSREQVGAVAGYSPSSGGFNNLIGGLRTAGYIDIPMPGHVSLANGAGGDLLTPEQARDQMLSVLSNPKRKIIDAMESTNPLAREVVGTRTGYSATSGGFNNLIGSLCTLGILTKPEQGCVALSPWAAELLAE